MRLIDPELLRTFLAFVDGGSLARAAEAVGRSASAVTAQMQRLEELVGEPLLVPEGRGRALTPAGAELTIHARRIIAAHREAWLSLKGAQSDGRIVLGATQDFTETVLPELLRTFVRSHPRVRLELRVGRSVELGQALTEGRIDVLIGMRIANEADETCVFREPMVWLASEEGFAVSGPELPLALLDQPCGFRTAALAALDMVGRSYRLAATSASLNGVHAAVRAGMAVTLRTARWMGNGLTAAPTAFALPVTPDAEFSIRLRAASEAAAQTLADLLGDALTMPSIGRRQA